MEQLDRCVSYFDNLILGELLGQAGCGRNCWIAGGALRDFFSYGYPHSDIDIYFSDEYELERAKEYFNEKVWNNEGAELIGDFTNSIDYRYKKHHFQLIKIYFPGPQETIDNFDFTVCCAAVDTVEVIHHDTFFIDLAARKLVINSLPKPLSTMQRMQKYIKKGFTICNGGLLALAKAIATIDFDNVDENHLEHYPDGTPRFVRLD